LGSTCHCDRNRRKGDQANDQLPAHLSTSDESGKTYWQLLRPSFRRRRKLIQKETKKPGAQKLLPFWSDRFRLFGKNSQMGGSRSHTADPETFTTVDGPLRRHSEPVEIAHPRPRDVGWSMVGFRDPKDRGEIAPSRDHGAHLADIIGGPPVY
jgi:hypothetical protein